MKKLIFVAMASVMMLGACSKNEVVNQDREAMGFGSYVSNATKAGSSLVDNAVSATLPANSSFGVYSYLADKDGFDGTPVYSSAALVSPNFMKNQKVDYTGTLYNYTPLQYWPSDEANNKLTFFAYYPYDAAIAPVFSAANLLGSYSYSVPDAALSQDDFMLSDVVKNQVASTNKGVVPLVFHHMLSQINVKVALDADIAAASGTVVTLKGVTFSTIKNDGTLAAADAALNSVWAAGTSTASYVTLADRNLASSATTPIVTTAAEALMMIPQSFADTDAAITLVYTTKTGDFAEVTNTKTVKLSTLTDGVWKINNKYTYIFTIGLSERVIKFTASVEPWVSEDVVL